MTDVTQTTREQTAIDRIAGTLIGALGLTLILRH